MTDLSVLSVRDLLQLNASIGDELRAREICRTSNNPVGDVAEFLFHRTFGWKLETNSKAGFDAVCPKLGNIQIKSRRVSLQNPSRQAGAIRNLDKGLFDYLAGVVFDHRYEVHIAMLIPHHLVVKQATDIYHTRSSRIYLRDDWLKIDGVQDLTGQVRNTWAAINAV
jgi:hypothetical protein